MATTPEGQALTAEHHQAQQLLVAALIRQLVELWQEFPTQGVDQFWPGLRAAITSMVRQQHPRSAVLSGDYYRRFRAAEGVPGTANVQFTEPLDQELVKATLDITGPVSFKQGIIRGKTPEKARDRALVTAQGAVSRLVLDGGRSTIGRTIESDSRALGWARVADDDPCAFCAMLASRGFVYGSQKIAGDFRVGGMPFHNGDQCVAEPAFHRNAKLPGRGQEFQDLWYEATEDYYGEEKLLAFRRAYEARRHESVEAAK